MKDLLKTSMTELFIIFFLDIISLSKLQFACKGNSRQSLKPSETMIRFHYYVHFINKKKNKLKSAMKMKFCKQNVSKNEYSSKKLSR